MSKNDIKDFIDLFEREVNNSSKVFVLGHHHYDFDSLGSAIGIAYLTKEYNKDCFIILDEDDSKLEPGVKRIIDKIIR